MVKKVRINPGVKQAALAAIGWISFIAGVLVPEPLAKLPLLALARVLP
jgi:hypothetical protein